MFFVKLKQKAKVFLKLGIFYWLQLRGKFGVSTLIGIQNKHIRNKSTVHRSTWIYNKVRELIAVEVLHTSLLITTVVAFKLLPLGSYAPMPALSPPFKTILELVLWNGLQSCRCITPDAINAIKMPSFQYFLYLREQKKVTGG